VLCEKWGLCLELPFISLGAPFLASCCGSGDFVWSFHLSRWVPHFSRLLREVGLCLELPFISPGAPFLASCARSGDFVWSFHLSRWVPHFSRCLREVGTLFGASIYLAGCPISRAFCEKWGLCLGLPFISPGAPFLAPFARSGDFVWGFHLSRR